MLTIESVIGFAGLVVGFGIVFLWGVRIGRNLQYKEVQKVTQFLSILKNRKIFQSEESITPRTGRSYDSSKYSETE